MVKKTEGLCRCNTTSESCDGRPSRKFFAGFFSTEAETYERQLLQGIYRSQAPLEDNLPFLSRLNLRTVLHLSPEVLIRGVVDWMDEKRVTLYNMGLQVGATVTTQSIEKESSAFRSNKRKSAFRPAREKADFRPTKMRAAWQLARSNPAFRLSREIQPFGQPLCTLFTRLFGNLLLSLNRARAVRIDLLTYYFLASAGWTLHPL